MSAVNNNNSSISLSDNTPQVDSSAYFGKNFISNCFESNIENLKYKIERKSLVSFGELTKCNTKREKFKNIIQVIHNRIANALIKGRKNSLEDVKNVIIENDIGRFADININEISLHKSIKNEVLRTKESLNFYQQIAPTEDENENIARIKKTMDILTNIYAVLNMEFDEIFSPEDSLAFVHHEREEQAEPQYNHLNEIIKISDGYVNKNVRIKSESLANLNQISKFLKQNHIPGFEIKNGKIRNFDKWIKDCGMLLKPLITISKPKKPTKNENILSNDKLESIFTDLKNGKSSYLSEGTSGKTYKITQGDKSYAVKLTKNAKFTEDKNNQDSIDLTEEDIQKFNKELELNNILMYGIEKVEEGGVKFPNLTKCYGGGEAWQDKDGNITFKEPSEDDIKRKKMEKIFFIIQEFNEGVNLQDIIYNNVDKSECAKKIKNVLKTPKGRLEVIAKMISGIAQLHSLGIVNRDIKPGNMIINIDESNNISVKIIDLGESYYLPYGYKNENDTSNLFSFKHGIRSTKGIGSMTYMAPEILNQEDEKTGHPMVDVFALGISIAEVLLGCSLFPKENFPFPWKIAEYKTSTAFSQEDKTFEQLINDTHGNVQQEKLLSDFPDQNLREQLSELIMGCIKANPKKRFSIDDVTTKMMSIIYYFNETQKNQQKIDYDFSNLDGDFSSIWETERYNGFFHDFLCCSDAINYANFCEDNTVVLPQQADNDSDLSKKTTSSTRG